MRTWMIGCLIFVMLPAVSSAQDTTRTDEQLLVEADDAFRQGVESKTRILQARKHFSTAADAYLELHGRGVRSPALYLNLGNAAALADRWPEAIWAFHMGLKLDPNDRAMREHLGFVRAKVLYPAAGQGRLDSDSWPLWLHRPTVNELWFVFALAYVLIWVAGTGAFLSRSTQLWLYAIVAVVAAVASAAGFSTKAARRDRSRDAARRHRRKHAVLPRQRRQLSAAHCRAGLAARPRSPPNPSSRQLAANPPQHGRSRLAARGQVLIVEPWIE